MEKKDRRMHRINTEPMNQLLYFDIELYFNCAVHVLCVLWWEDWWLNEVGRGRREMAKKWGRCSGCVTLVWLRFKISLTVNHILQYFPRQLVTNSWNSPTNHNLPENPQRIPHKPLFAKTNQLLPTRKPSICKSFWESFVESLLKPGASLFIPIGLKSARRRIEEKKD